MESLIEIYPFNLARALSYREEAMKIYIPGFYAAVEMLGEVKSSLLKMRYSDHASVEECAEKLNMTVEGIEDLEKQAFRRLVDPEIRSMFEGIPSADLHELKAKLKKINREYDVLIKSFELLSTMSSPTEGHAILTGITMLYEKPLDKLNLSLRTYNCLMRAGKETLGDIAYLDMEDLIYVRNLGPRGAKEVMNCLRRHGLSE